MTQTVTSTAAELHDHLLRNMPDGAHHDADLCPFCLKGQDHVAADEVAEMNDTKPEGGIPSMTDDMLSRDTHEALLEKALREATADTAQELAEAKQAAEGLQAEKAALTEEISSLKAEVTRLNSELDTAQVNLKAVSDTAAELRKEITDRDQAALVAEIASERAKQVKGLGLFTDEYIAEKASLWASLGEADWSSRLEEWGNLRPVATTADTASAMTGTSGSLTEQADEQSTISAAHRVLGLG